MRYLYGYYQKIQIFRTYVDSVEELTIGSKNKYYTFDLSLSNKEYIILDHECDRPSILGHSHAVEHKVRPLIHFFDFSKLNIAKFVVFVKYILKRDPLREDFTKTFIKLVYVGFLSH